jgi:ABC-2 type transport system permease protein
VGHILTILRVDMLGMWNGITRGRKRAVFSTCLGVLFFFGFIGVVGFGGFKFASFTRDTFADYPTLICRIEFNVLSASSIAAFVMLLLTGIRVIYGNFYESGDLSFLMSTPLPIRSVFGAKFLKSLGTNLLSLFPLNGALWVGYGIAVGALPLFYVVVVVTLLCVTSLFTALASLIVMIIMRVIPSQKMKQIIMTLSLLVALIGVFVGQYVSVAMSGDTRMDPAQLLESTGGWGLEKVSYMPNVWMAKSILLFVDGYSYSFSESLLPLLAASVLLVLMSMSLAEWTFLSGWSQSRETDAGRKLTTAKRLTTEQKAFAGRSGVFYGVLRKDIRILMRTPMMWYNFLVGFIIVGFMVYRMAVQGEEPSAEEVPFVKMLFLFIVLLMSASMSGFSSSFSVSLEGKSWWIIQYLPIKSAAFYLHKKNPKNTEASGL